MTANIRRNECLVSAISLRGNELDRGKSSAENGHGGDAEPAVEESGVNRAEIGRVFEVAVVEIGEARVGAKDAGFRGTRHHEHLRSGAMVSAEAAVFLEAAAEFGVGR